MRVWPIWGHEKNLESTSQRWCVFSTFFINLALYLQKVLKQLFPKFCTLTLLPIRSSYCVIVRVRVVLKRTVAGDWRFDSEDDFRSDCRNVSHQQQFFSELPSPGRSPNTNYWYSWVQTIYYTAYTSRYEFYLTARVRVDQVSLSKRGYMQNHSYENNFNYVWTKERMSTTGHQDTLWERGLR